MIKESNKRYTFKGKVRIISKLPKENNINVYELVIQKKNLLISELKGMRIRILDGTQRCNEWHNKALKIDLFSSNIQTIVNNKRISKDTHTANDATIRQMLHLLGIFFEGWKKNIGKWTGIPLEYSFCSPAHPEKSFSVINVKSVCVYGDTRLEYANLRVLNLKILPSEVLLDPFIINHLILEMTIR